MTPNLALRPSMIVHAPQVVAIGHGCERAVEWKNFEAVTRQVQFANDLGAQE
jgi:hypothetical protein